MLTLLVLYWAYAPGITGSPHFDDWPNLNGLDKVETPLDAAGFVLSGRAGPVGRPLALASFLPQSSAWPADVGALIQVNVFIHLINVSLLAWLSWAVMSVHAAPIVRQRAVWLALGVAALWGSLPLLASTSLMVIQRMTSLAATFTLLGLIGFVYGTNLARREPLSGVLLCLCSLGAGTVLAVLCKENGALLPLYAGLLLMVLPRPQHRTYKAACAIGIGAPVAAIAAYLLYRVTDPPSVIRDYDTSQRVASQLVILWEYWRHVLLPSPNAFHPFHDGRQAVSSWANTAVIVAGLLWAAAIAVAILTRKRSVLPAFAIGWYLGGHALESTVLPLELYFEHRNYVPMMGPCLALFIGLAQLPRAWQRLAWFAVAAFTALQVLVLYAVADLWGRPRVAAEIWYEANPRSTRAAQHLARFYAAEGDHAGAYKIIDRTFQQTNRNTALALQRIQMRCAAGRDIRDLLADDRMAKLLSEGQFSSAVLSGLDSLHELVADARCSLTTDDLIEMIERLRANPAYSWPTSQVSMLLTLSRLYRHPEDSGRIVDAINQAYLIDPQPEIGLDLVVALRNAERDCEALVFLQNTIDHPPESWNLVTRKRMIPVYEKFRASMPIDECAVDVPASSVFPTTAR
ncbi:hypothetical protein [Sinimarinibacterium thermocellulolyticum]|uniref:hypothetical protein n=1 Tax=Sinimarinibacterium thermocellulolyticum TaxID=3170016 RepID=UPI00333A17AD